MHPESSLNSGIWRTLAWIGVVLQGLAVVLIVLLQRWHGLWSMGIFLVLTTAFLSIRNRLPSLLDFLVVVAALLNAGGWAWGWFHQFAWFDELIHFYSALAGMAAIGYIAADRGWIRAEPGSAGFVLRVAAAGLVLGIAWEIAEALFLNLTLGDTIADLVLDTLGAAVGGGLAGWVLHKTHSHRGGTWGR